MDIIKILKTKNMKNAYIQRDPRCMDLRVELLEIQLIGWDVKQTTFKEGEHICHLV